MSGSVTVNVILASEIRMMAKLWKAFMDTPSEDDEKDKRAMEAASATLNILSPVINNPDGPIVMASDIDLIDRMKQGTRIVLKRKAK